MTSLDERINLICTSATATCGACFTPACTCRKIKENGIRRHLDAHRTAVIYEVLAAVKAEFDSVNDSSVVENGAVANAIDNLEDAIERRIDREVWAAEPK